MITTACFRGWTIWYDGQHFSWEGSEENFPTLQACAESINRWEAMLQSQPKPMGGVSHA